MYEKNPRPVQFLTPRNLTVSLRPRNPIIGTVACCPRAASGHAAIEPAITLMKVRRLMQPAPGLRTTLILFKVQPSRHLQRPHPARWGGRGWRHFAPGHIGL